MSLREQILATIALAGRMRPIDLHETMLNRGFTRPEVSNELAVLWDEGEVKLTADRFLEVPPPAPLGPHRTRRARRTEMTDTAYLDDIDKAYGTGGDPCPFCGGVLGTGHLTLTRRDGQVTRCQVGDVRGLAKRLREAQSTQKKDTPPGLGVSRGCDERSPLEAGDRFTQIRSGREVVVLDPEYEDGMVSFYYADKGPSDWFYCTVDEVIIFTGSYKRLPRN